MVTAAPDGVLRTTTRPGVGAGFAEAADVFEAGSCFDGAGASVIVTSVSPGAGAVEMGPLAGGTRGDMTLAGADVAAGSTDRRCNAN